MLLPLIAGVIFENRRLSSDWNTILLKILGSVFLSFIAFLPYKREDIYSFENHIREWPYWFISFFVLMSVIYHEKKIIPKLTEGITLLQSISIIYWIIDIGFLNDNNVFSITLMGIGLMFCLLSFLHAFTYMRLTKNWRLTLSIWSSLIMIIFAMDHIYRVLNFTLFIEYQLLNEILNILQYFLLGVSLIYIFQNANMLMVYLPDRSGAYGKSQMIEIRKMNENHIKRYSLKQINIGDAFLVLIASSIIYYLNYEYKLMPRHTLIWSVFWIAPFLVIGRKLVTKKTRANIG